MDMLQYKEDYYD